MIATLLPLIVQLLEMTPQIITGAEDFVSGIETAWSVASSNTTPTAAEQAQYDTALEAAHAALQAS